MATDQIQSSVPLTAERESLSVFDMVRALLSPLASLKLTVVLLALAIFVTFVATVEQTRADVYDVKMHHFSHLFVTVPFQVFFVPAWCPNYQNVPGSFVMPSGMLILVLMLINLTAAHLMRFKLQATGLRLAMGIAVASAAIFITWAVIFNGQNADGFQATPPISYKLMWMLMQFGLLVLATTATAAVFLTQREHLAERALLVIGAVISAILFGITLFLGERAFIGDSAMRVMYQLIQATMAALVAYAACVVLFKRKAGMVLLHLGIAGLMLNEIFVTVTNNEQRMTIFENQTVSHAIDIRDSEMAIINLSDSEYDQITVVPSSRLQREPVISNDALPFDIRCVKFLPASRAKPNPDPASNLANKGIGLRYHAVEIPPVAGTDSQQVVDFASAYVELLDKQDGRSLGVHLISQDLVESSADKVTVDGTDYLISLRFKTAYKPYSIFLSDAEQENYPGTNTPKHYGSKILLNDFQTGMESEQQISMNNPLRYSDETFYQSGMDRTEDGREYSIIQIVTNVGWMIPYVCCMFSVVGLVAQFGESLLGYLKKQRQSRSRKTAVSSASEEHRVSLSISGRLLKLLGSAYQYQPSPDDRSEPGSTESNNPAGALAKPAESSTVANLLGWLPTVVLVLAFSGWSWSLLNSADRPVAKDGMRLDLLGQIPITFEGRVQPLQSYAINTARQIREREQLDDGNNESRAAIEWFADVAFGAKGADDYRLFYITDPNIISALGLGDYIEEDRDRKKFVYTFDELEQAKDKLREKIPNPKIKDPKTWTTLEKRLSNLGTKYQRVAAMKEIFGLQDLSDDWLIRIQQYGGSLTSTLTPYLIAADEDERAWMSLTEAQSRLWLEQMGTEKQAKSLPELAAIMIDEKFIPAIRNDEIVQRVVRKLLSIPDFVDAMKKEYGTNDPQALGAFIKRDWKSYPEELRNNLEKLEAPLVDMELQSQRPKLIAKLVDELRPLNGNRLELASGKFDDKSYRLLNELRSAYLAGNAEQFNTAIESHLSAMKTAKPEGYSATQLTTERYYNAFTPFYVSLCTYVAASILVLLAWMCFAVPALFQAIARAAIALLLLGLLIHTSGIVMRMVISGRPPVTNLYSSVLFVGVVMVLILILIELKTQMGIGSLLAGLSGFFTLMWAHSMTVVDGDTFTVMVAVLDTTFWLATHVVCISLGYAATFVGGMLGIAFILGGLVTRQFANPDRRRLIVNLMYGVICFGLLTSFFGTVLGGLWGDDSWGRFWGWDPKENGALMIVLANALVLHARWGGMIKERGLAALAVLGNIVVLWSWKGVNAMGVGLHAYAGTDDPTLAAIVAFGLAHLVIALFALLPQTVWRSYPPKPA